jgi:hypothetical protein
MIKLKNKLKFYIKKLKNNSETLYARIKFSRWEEREVGEG